MGKGMDGWMDGVSAKGKNSICGKCGVCACLFIWGA